MNKKEKFIFLIDDSKIDIEILERHYEMLELPTKSITESAKAIEFIDKNFKDISIVVLDICMPEIDGISILGHIKEKYPEMPVILSSGVDEEDFIRVSMSYKGCLYLAKPFTFDKLKKLTENFLNSGSGAEGGV